MSYQKTDRTTLKRLPAQGHYDRDLVHKILDEGFICHVGAAADGGSRDSDGLWAHR